MPKRRRGPKKVVEAKDKLKKVLLENPEILERRPPARQVYAWLQENHPDIAEQLSLREVQGVYGYLLSPKFQLDQQSKRAKMEEGEGEGEGEPPAVLQGSDTPEKPLGAITQGSQTPETPPGLPGETSIGTNYIMPLGRPPSQGTGVLRPGEAIIEVEGVPVGTKIRLTPKSLLLFDWFKAKYGYEGDISDFINDAIEDFFRARGYEVMIVKKEEGVKGVV